MVDGLPPPWVGVADPSLGFGKVTMGYPTGLLGLLGYHYFLLSQLRDLGQKNRGDDVDIEDVIRTNIKKRQQHDEIMILGLRSWMMVFVFSCFFSVFPDYIIHYDSIKLDSWDFEFVAGKGNLDKEKRYEFVIT